VNDTHPSVQRVQIELLRRAGTTRRAALALSLSHSMITLSRRALKERMPGVSERDVLLRWVSLCYGRDLGERVAAYVSRK
jgi:hypothetical protein